MKKYFLILSICIVGQRTFAGTRVGNGGNVLVCKTRGQVQVQLLDHYEAHQRGDALDLGPLDLTPEEKVARVLTRLEKLNPTRMQAYQLWLTTFMSETKFTDGVIAPVADSGITDYPKNCQIVQTAGQQDPDLPGDLRYTIRKDLWNLLDNDGKAGLILHEIIYRELAVQKPAHTTSKYVRRFNSLLSSQNISKMTLHDYYDLLVRLQIANMDTQYGLPITLIEEKNPGELSYPTVEFFSANPNLVRVAQKPAMIITPIPYSWRGESLKVIDGLCTYKLREFNPDGTPACIDVKQDSIGLKFDFLTGRLQGPGDGRFSIQDRSGIDSQVLISNYYQGAAKMAFSGIESGIEKSFSSFQVKIDLQNRIIINVDPAENPNVPTGTKANLAHDTESLDQLGVLLGAPRAKKDSDISPEGTLTADTLYNAAGTTYFYQEVRTSLPAGVPVTYSLFMKDPHGGIGMGWGGAANITFDGVENIVDVGNGWYRHWRTGTTTKNNAVLQPQVYIVGEGDVTVWGLQLEVGSQPKAYVPVLSGNNTP